ncbi:MAG: PA2778 family cysteine peptidase [Candidatus Nitrotoga sp.]
MSIDKNARVQAGVLFLIMLLSGCATPQTQQLLHAPPKDLPAHVELTDVPFYPQDTHQCGPAALAMVLNAGGVQVTPDSLIKQVYLPGREGSLQVEMLASARRNGLLAYPLESSRQNLSLQNLLTEVAAGTPVVVLQNLALRWYPVWHYAVVIGYDLPRQEIILRSGLEQRLIMPLTTFEYTWQRAAYWAMLALPAGTMPHTATEDTYIKAAVALEKNITPQENMVVYQAALKKWTNNLTAYIGLGNAFYTLGDKEQAERILHQATLAHPDSAIAFNNLAQTLADQKRYIEAFSAAKQAVRLAEIKGDSEEQSITQVTLNEIQEKMH